jgi:hypothetical protein
MTQDEMARRHYAEEQETLARNLRYAALPGKAAAGFGVFFLCMAVGMGVIFFGLFLLGKLSRLVD